MKNFDWVIQVAPIECPRKYLQYVTVRGDLIAASNGALFMAAFNDEGLHPGVYDENRTPVILDDEEGEFPDFDFLLPPIPEKAMVPHRLSKLPSKYLNTNIQLVLINGFWYQHEMIELVIGDDDSFLAFTNTRSDSKFATLMIQPNEGKPHKTRRVGVLMNFNQ